MKLTERMGRSEIEPLAPEVLSVFPVDTLSHYLAGYFLPQPVPDRRAGPLGHLARHPWRPDRLLQFDPLRAIDHVGRLRSQIRTSAATQGTGCPGAHRPPANWPRRAMGGDQGGGELGTSPIARPFSIFMMGGSVGAQLHSRVVLGKEYRRAVWREYLRHRGEDYWEFLSEIPVVVRGEANEGIRGRSRSGLCRARPQAGRFLSSRSSRRHPAPSW